MLNANAFGKALAVTSAVFWIVCSLLIMVMPGMMMDMTGNMVHADLDGMSWQMPLTGFLAGLVVWSVGAGLFGWLAATCYNRFSQ